MRYLAVIPFFLLALGCSDSPDPVTTPSESSVNPNETNETSSNTGTSGLDALYGTWVIPCYAIDDGGANYYSEFTFSSTQMMRADFSYAPADAACASPSTSSETTFEATYLGDLQPTAFGDAIKADLVPIGYVSTGDFEWDSTTDGLPDGVESEFTIFAIANDRLYFGDFSTGSGETPQTRPTEADPDSGFPRK